MLKMHDKEVVTIDIQQLKYFKTVAETKHITKSSEKLSISQSALSRSISNLEKEIGAPLFTRKNRQIELNKFGEIILHRTNNILSELSQGQREIAEMLEPNTGNISFGFLHTLATSHIPNIIANFQQAYPNINLQLKQGPSHQISRLIAKEEIDLALLSPINLEKSVVWHKLWEEPMYLVVPKNHELSKRTSITTKELQNEHFIMLKEGFSIREISDRLFKEAGVIPHITFEGEELDTVAGLVAVGLGISIMPKISALRINDLVTIDIEDENSHREIGLSWKDSHYLSPASRRFQEFLINMDL